MRIRNRSLLPLPPISHSLALLNLPSKNQNPHQQLQQRKKELQASTVAAAARGGEEERERRLVQGLHLKGDHTQQDILAKDDDDKEENYRSTASITTDVLVTIRKKRNGCISSRSSQAPNPLQPIDDRQVKLEDEEQRFTATRNHNSNSKSWDTESVAGNWLLPSFSASCHYHHRHRHQVAGRWFEVGEEASLKKRLGSTAGVDEEEKKENTRKRRLGKKNFNVEKEEREEEKDGSDDSSNLVKKKRNDNSSNSSSSGGGSSVMEGSRCSRVNGRGWRCCQQTLVGYALCEHHLGKGRLRSMVSVRSHSSSTAIAVVRPGDDEGSLSLSLPFEQHWESGEEGGLEEKLLVMKEKNKNKRKKIGMVKARSISSLLSQTNYAATAATED